MPWTSKKSSSVLYPETWAPLLWGPSKSACALLPACKKNCVLKICAIKSMCATLVSHIRIQLFQCNNAGQIFKTISNSAHWQLVKKCAFAEFFLLSNKITIVSVRLSFLLASNHRCHLLWEPLPELRSVRSDSAVTSLRHRIKSLAHLVKRALWKEHRSDSSYSIQIHWNYRLMISPTWNIL